MLHGFPSLDSAYLGKSLRTALVVVVVVVEDVEVVDAVALAANVAALALVAASEHTGTLSHP
jgi:hypothetical protein